MNYTSITKRKIALYSGALKGH